MGAPGGLAKGHAERGDAEEEREEENRAEDARPSEVWRLEGDPRRGRACRELEGDEQHDGPGLGGAEGDGVHGRHHIPEDEHLLALADEDADVARRSLGFSCLSVDGVERLHVRAGERAAAGVFETQTSPDGVGSTTRSFPSAAIFPP